jgi:electron transfer flavoprotein alpha subunit
MADKILGILEQREGKLKKTAFEVVTTVKRISEELNAPAEVLVIGNDIENMQEIAGYGVSKVVYFKHPELADYSASAYSKIISDYVPESGTDILVFAHSSLGVDLAPRVAVKLNAGILTDCTEIAADETGIRIVRPVYAGKALLEARLNSTIKIFTIRPNVFKPVKVDGINLEVAERSAENPDLSTRTTSYKKSEGKLDVAEADIIVSGGRGLKGPENFHLVENLASELGAAVGASRAVVDAGWRPHREQVGQTGKTVSPSLYIACGISGAIQHLAGMSSSKYIVAINKDKDAPIFSVADYGIAGDIFEILPVLTEEIKKIKQ